MLKYYKISGNNEIIFPYRALLKILFEFDSITRFEFLYGFYSLLGTTQSHIDEGIDRVLYLRETYPGIEVLSTKNKDTVLEMLNSRFSVNFNYKDVWTAKTTAYNQFNYFKQHLACFENVINLDLSTSTMIVKRTGANSMIQSFLNTTEIIETCSDTDLDILYTSKIT